MQKKWMQKVHRLLCWKPDEKVIGAGMVLLLVVLLLPLLRISFYAVPWYDDYNYGNFTRNFLTEEYSLGSALQGVWYCIRTQWYAWQGTFSSIFFMSLVPSVWGDSYYVLGPLFLILLPVAAVFAMVRVLTRTVLEAGRTSCLILQTGAAVFVITLIYHSQSGFFWYNTGVHYVGMHSFGILLVAGAIHLLYTERKAARLLLAAWTLLGAVLTGGSNYVTALQSFLVLGSLLVLGLMKFHKKGLWLLPSAVVYGISFYMNVSAPGNAVRGAQLAYLSMDAGTAVLQSFVEAGRFFWTFTGFITIAVLVALAPVILRMVARCTFSFQYPGLLIVWSLCLYATGFTPSLYSMGSPGLARTLNAVKMTFQLLLLINEVYLMGYFCHRKKAHGKQIWDGRAHWWFYPAMGMVMLMIFTLAPNQAGCYSSYAAYYYVHTGEAACFYQEYMDRIRTIQDSGSDVEVVPYHFKPWALCAGDLSEDAEAEENKAIAQWYHKETVVCRE